MPEADMLREQAIALIDLADKLDDFEHQSDVDKLEGIACIAFALKTTHCLVKTAVRATLERARTEMGYDADTAPEAN